MNTGPVTKILHIASGDLWAGAEVQLFTLVKTLHHFSGVSVRVVLLNQGVLAEKLQKEGIGVLVFDESSMNSFLILARFVRTIKEYRPDVIHTHRIKENIFGSIAGFLAGGVPSLRTAHGAPEHRPSWRQFPKRIIRTFDWIVGKFFQHRIIAVSEDLAEILRCDFPPEKIRVIENGIDVDSFHSHTVRPTHALDNQSDTFRIGLAGRLVPVKRVDLFIKTARYTQDNYPDLKAEFYIFGDGPLRAEMETLSRELGTEDIIHFEGHCDDLTERLQKLDILMMTSDHEGLPMILLEAMVLKVPIIAHATGGIPVLLDHGSCGVLVEEHTLEGYAHQVHRLSLSKSVRSELAEMALERVKLRYSAEENARAYLLQYNEIH